jgi:hypothetical protein
MGWWDCGVLGGDPPLDAIADIEEVLGIEDLYPVGSIEDRDAVAARFGELGLGVVCDTVAGRGDRHVATQVVTVVAMAVGAPLGDFAQRARDAAESDPWAAQEPERRQVMDALVAAIDAYDGTPSVVPSPGLFDVIDRR